MNTRGLMELIILNIGLQEGVITPVVFAMMVLMALATTGLTTPILHWIYPARLFGVAEADAKARRTEPPKTSYFSTLIPVSLPESGVSLARLAGMLIGAKQAAVEAAGGTLFALHLRRFDGSRHRCAGSARSNRGRRSVAASAAERGKVAEYSDRADQFRNTGMWRRISLRLPRGNTHRSSSWVSTSP